MYYFILPLSCIAAMTVGPAFGGSLLIATMAIQVIEKQKESRKR